MARTCVFCGATPLTKEHTLPKWLKSALASDGSSALHVRETETTRIQHFASAYDATVKIVCASCNNGWMNGLEHEVRPFLPNLINGRTVDLTTEDQKALASWSLKTMFMFAGQNRHPRLESLPLKDCAALYHDREPSRFMIARIGAMEPWGDDEGTAMVEFVCPQYSWPSPTTDPTYLSTLRIGWLLVQLVRAGSLNEDQILAPFDTHPMFHPLWPVGDTVTWPPPRHIPAAHMAAIACPPTLPLQVALPPQLTVRA